MSHPASELREGETAVALPERFDAGLYFIGRIHTPWRERAACPRQGDAAGPPCEVEVDAPFAQALDGIAAGDRLQLLYFMHEARRDIVRQMPRGAASPKGAFALRSPIRPNPIASSTVVVDAVAPGRLRVRGLDCIDGTPLVDIKPQLCPQASR